MRLKRFELFERSNPAVYILLVIWIDVQLHDLIRGFAVCRNDSSSQTPILCHLRLYAYLFVIEFVIVWNLEEKPGVVDQKNCVCINIADGKEKADSPCGQAFVS